MADLWVAPSHEGVTGEAILEAIPVAGNFASAAESLGNGDIGSAIIDTAGTALDVVDMVVNPIATLISSCASFMLDYISPLHETLEFITGSPEMVRALGETWDNLGTALQEVATERDAAIAALGAGWAGVASEAYARVAQGLSQITATVGGACHGVANGMRMAAMVVEIVYEIVKSIISDLVGQIIQSAIIAIATVGLGAPAVVAQCSPKIAKAIDMVMKWVEKIQKFMTKISKAVEELTQFQDILKVDLKKVDAVLFRNTDTIRVPVVDLVNIFDAVRTSYDNNYAEAK